MATLDLNVNTKQAEARLRALGIAFVDTGKRAEDAQNALNTAAENIEKGISKLNVTSLSMGVAGRETSAAIKLAGENARVTAAEFTKLVTSGANLKGVYDGLQGVQYRFNLNQLSALKTVQALDSQFNKHAQILSELNMLENGYTQTMAKSMAVDEAKLAISKIKNQAYKEEILLIKGSTIAVSNLTTVEKENLAIAMGTASAWKAKTVATTEATVAEVEYSAAAVRTAAATQTQSMAMKVLAAQSAARAKIQQELYALENGYAVVMERNLAADKAKLAIQQQLFLREKALIDVRTKELILQSSLTEAEKQAALASLGLSQAKQKALISTKGLHGAIRGLAGGLGQLWMAYGTVLPMIAAFAAAATGLKLIKTGMEFEYLAKYIHAIDTPLEGAAISINDLYDRLLSIKDVAHTPVELATGVKELVKAGFPASEAIGNIAKMSQFATVAEIDMNEASEIAITQFKAWGKESRQFGEGLTNMQQGMEAIAYVANETKASVHDMGISLSYTTALANTSGASFYEIVGAVGALADVGIEGSKAGTALTTSITRMQNPTPKTAKLLRDLNIQIQTMDENGRLKGPIQLFEELNKQMQHLSQGDQARVMKELFGLTAIKAGVNMTYLVDKVKALAAESKKVAEAGSYIDEAFKKLSDTAKIQFKFIISDFSKQLIKVFDSKSFTDSLKEVRDFINSDSFTKGLQSFASGLLTTIKLLTQILGIMGSLQKLGADFADTGLLSIALFGAGGPVTWIAGLALVAKKTLEIADWLHEVRFGAEERMNNTPTVSSHSSLLPGQLVASSHKAAIEMKNLSDNTKDASKNAIVEVETIGNLTKTITNSERITTSYFKSLSSGIKDFATESADLWKEYENNSIISFDNMDASSTNYYDDLQRKATESYSRQQEALSKYVDYFSSDIVEKLGTGMGLFKGTLEEISVMMESGLLSDKEMKSLGDGLKKAAEAGKASFEAMNATVEKGIDNITQKEQKLFADMKGYMDDIKNATETAGKARFDLEQKGRTEAEQYEANIKRMNELFETAKKLGSVSTSLTGEDRKNVYEQSKTALSEALGIAQNLQSTEANGVSQAKAKEDALSAINKYEEISVKNANNLKDATANQITELESAKQKLVEMQQFYQDAIAVFNNAITINFNTENAQEQINALVQSVTDVFGDSAFGGIFNAYSDVIGTEVQDLSQRITNVLNFRQLSENMTTDMQAVATITESNFDQAFQEIKGFWKRSSDQMTQDGLIFANSVESALAEVARPRTIDWNIVFHMDDVQMPKFPYMNPNQGNGDMSGSSVNGTSVNNSTVINVNQKVSRSDIVGIANGLKRTESRR